MGLLTIKRAILRQKYFWKNLKFGFGTAFWLYMESVNSSDKIYERKMRCLYEFAQKKFKKQIKQYSENQDNKLGEYKGKIPIWIYWAQGIENRPKLVELCHKSVEKNIPSDKAEIIFLDNSNYSKYISIPQHIVKKHNEGKIGHAHFSDYLRYSLLAEYGGLWLDSTVLVTDKIGDDILCSDFYTLKINDENKYPREPSRAIWNTFVFLSKPNSVLFSFLRDCLSEYWKKYNSIIDYILVDYIIKLAYDNFSQVRNSIDNLKPNISDMCITLDSMNKEYNEQLYEIVTENADFHKLTYRWEMNEYTKDGKLTLFGYFCEKYL